MDLRVVRNHAQASSACWVTWAWLSKQMFFYCNALLKDFFKSLCRRGRTHTCHKNVAIQESYKQNKWFFFFEKFIFFTSCKHFIGRLRKLFCHTSVIIENAYEKVFLTRRNQNTLKNIRRERRHTGGGSVRVWNPSSSGDSFKAY